MDSRKSAKIPASGGLDYEKDNLLGKSAKVDPVTHAHQKQDSHEDQPGECHGHKMEDEEEDGKLPNIVNIFLEASHLPDCDLTSRSDPFAKVFIREANNKHWAVVGTTEVIENELSPKWSTSMKVNYYFEKQQIMKFVVYDDEGEGQEPTELGHCETTLAKLMAARRQELKEKLCSPKDESEIPKTKLTIKAESVGDSNNQIQFKVKAVIPQMRKCFNLCPSQDNPYLLIERSRDMNAVLELNKDKVINKKTQETEPRNFDLPPEIIKINQDGEEVPYKPGPIRDCEDHDHLDTTGCDFVIVHQSKVYEDVDESQRDMTCEFDEEEMQVQLFCNNDNKTLLKFSVLNENLDGDDPVYGFFTTTFDLLLAEPNPTERLHTLWTQPNEQGKPIGYIQFDIFVLNEKPSFSDYLKSGWKINMSVAIDFTASNGDPHEDDSLHSQRPNEPDYKNDYEKAMESVGTILESYAYNKMFLAYGFGGIPKYMGETKVNNCFNLSGTKDPKLEGLDTLIKTYKEKLEKIELYGPTFFADIVKTVYKCAKSTENIKDLDIYHVLLILTDGGINDMRQTIDQIVKASKMPISIIIVGIGNADFSNMDTLDADDVALVDSNCTKMERDIVQFVEYNEYSGDQGLLAEKVLCEVPEQLVGYMLDKGIKPTYKQNKKK